MKHLALCKGERLLEQNIIWSWADFHTISFQLPSPPPLCKSADWLQLACRLTAPFNYSTLNHNVNQRFCGIPEHNRKKLQEDPGNSKKGIWGQGFQQDSDLIIKKAKEGKTGNRPEEPRCKGRVRHRVHRWSGEWPAGSCPETLSGPCNVHKNGSCYSSKGSEPLQEVREVGAQN